MCVYFLVHFEMAARMLVSEHGTVCWKYACYGINIFVGGIESLACLAHFIGNKPNIRGSPGDESYWPTQRSMWHLYDTDLGG